MRLTIAAVALLGFPASGCQAPFPRDIDRALRSWVDHGDVVGAEVLVIRNGDTLAHEAYGWMDREAQRPMRLNSIFSLASLTKPVTALAVLILANDGKLSLDDPVSRYLPGFRGDPRATVQDLLSQTSGDGGEHGGGGFNIYEFPTLEAWVADWAASEATGEYGQFRYSNFNYAALGYIVERVSGVGLGRFMTERILTPLGMHDSFVSFSPDSSWAGRVPTSYVWSRDSDRYEVFWTADRPQRWKFFPGALGLWGTAEDYARFVTFFLDLGVTGGRRLLPAEAVRTALEPHGFRDGEPLYGFGWFVDALRTEDGWPLSFRHGGGDGTLAIAYPADRGIVVYLSQSERPPDHVAAFQNLVGMSGLFDHPGPSMRWARTSDVDPLPLAAGQRADYTGSYRGAAPWLDGVDWEVEVRDAAGVLDLSMGAVGRALREHLHLVPIGEDLFTYGRYERGELIGVDRAPPTRVRFVRDAGPGTGLEVSLEGELELRVARIAAVR